MADGRRHRLCYSHHLHASVVSLSPRNRHRVRRDRAGCFRERNKEVVESQRLLLAVHCDPKETRLLVVVRHQLQVRVRGLETRWQRPPLFIFFDLVQKPESVGVAPCSSNDIGHLLAVQGALEPLIGVYMAGQHRGGDAPRGLNDPVERDFNVRIASVRGIERVWGMVDGNNQRFIFRRAGYLIFKPLLLLACASGVKRAVNV